MERFLQMAFKLLRGNYSAREDFKFTALLEFFKHNSPIIPQDILGREGYIESNSKFTFSPEDF